MTEFEMKDTAQELEAAKSRLRKAPLVCQRGHHYGGNIQRDIELVLSRDATPITEQRIADLRGAHTYACLRVDAAEADLAAIRQCLSDLRDQMDQSAARDPEVYPALTYYSQRLERLLMKTTILIFALLLYAIPASAQENLAPSLFLGVASADAISTLIALERPNTQEGNPLLTPMAAHPKVMMSVVLAADVTTALLLRRLSVEHPKLTRVLFYSGAAFRGWAVWHNLRVGR